MYGTIIDCDAYMATRLYSQNWRRANTDTKTKALEHASRLIDQLAYKGAKEDPEQTTAFPRVDIGTPESINRAAYETALSLLSVDPEELQRDRNLTSVAFASVRHSYDSSVQADNVAAGIPSITAWRYLLPYLAPMDVIDRRRIN